MMLTDIHYGTSFFSAAGAGAPRGSSAGSGAGRHRGGDTQITLAEPVDGERDRTRLLLVVDGDDRELAGAADRNAPIVVVKLGADRVGLDGAVDDVGCR